MTPDTQCRADESPLVEAERLLTAALALLDGSQAHLAAAYTATALDALARYLDQSTTSH